MGKENGRDCSKKTFLFFEHKGTRIFETNKSLFYKKHDIHPFLNYPIFFMNEMPVFPYIFPFDHPVYPGEHNDLSGSSTRTLVSAHMNVRISPHERSRHPARTQSQLYTNVHAASHERSNHPILIKRNEGDCLGKLRKMCFFAHRINLFYWNEL